MYSCAPDARARTPARVCRYVCLRACVRACVCVCARARARALEWSLRIRFCTFTRNITHITIISPKVNSRYSHRFQNCFHLYSSVLVSKQFVKILPEVSVHFVICSLCRLKLPQSGHVYSNCIVKRRSVFVT